MSTSADRGVGLPVLLGNVVLALAFWAAGIALLLRGTTGAVVGGVLVLLLAVVITLTVVANVAMRRFPVGLPAPVAATRDGEAAVRIPAWGFGAAITPVITSFAGVAGTLLGLGAILSGRVVFGVVALPAGLFLLWLTVLVATGRIPLRAGVWLTPTRVVVVQAGAVLEVPWDDLAPAVARGTQSLVAARSGRVGGRRTNLLGVRRTPEQADVVVEHARLGVPPSGLVALLTRYADDPAARAELGTEAGVRRVRAEAYDVLGGSADAAQHPARQPR